jgi:hypothetical protein
MESSARRAGINIEAEPAFRKISDDAIGDLVFEAGYGFVIPSSRPGASVAPSLDVENG